MLHRDAPRIAIRTEKKNVTARGEKESTTGRTEAIKQGVINAAIREVIAGGMTGTIEGIPLMIGEGTIVMMGGAMAAILEGTAGAKGTERIAENVIAQEKENEKCIGKEGTSELVIAAMTAGITAVMGEATTGVTNGGMIAMVVVGMFLGIRMHSAMQANNHRRLMPK